MRQINRLYVARKLKSAADSGSKNDFKRGQDILQHSINKLSREVPIDEFSQQYGLYI